MSKKSKEPMVYKDLMNIVRRLRESKFSKQDAEKIMREEARKYAKFAKDVYNVSGEDYKRLVEQAIESY